MNKRQKRKQRKRLADEFLEALIQVHGIQVAKMTLPGRFNRKVRLKGKGRLKVIYYGYKRGLWRGSPNQVQNLPKPPNFIPSGNFVIQSMSYPRDDL